MASADRATGCKWPRASACACGAMVMTAAFVGGCREQTASDAPFGVTKEATVGTETLVVPIDARIDGKTYGDWGAMLWELMYAEPRANNPIEDTDGSHCADRQPRGDVWFLHRNFGGMTVRRCTIPNGKYLFFPLVDAFQDYPCPDPSFQPGPRQPLKDFLTDGYGEIPGAVQIVEPYSVAAEVDGASIPNVSSYLAHSRFVSFAADLSWRALDPCVTGTHQKAVAAGRYLMLAPLSPGAHELHFHAEKPGCVIDVKYYLDVEEAEDRMTGPLAP